MVLPLNFKNHEVIPTTIHLPKRFHCCALCVAIDLCRHLCDRAMIQVTFGGVLELDGCSVPIFYLNLVLNINNHVFHGKLTEKYAIAGTAELDKVGLEVVLKPLPPTPQEISTNTISKNTISLLIDIVIKLFGRYQILAVHLQYPKRQLDRLSKMYCLN